MIELDYLLCSLQTTRIVQVNKMRVLKVHGLIFFKLNCNLCMDDNHFRDENFKFQLNPPDHLVLRLLENLENDV